MSLTGLWRVWGFNEWVSLIGCLGAGDNQSSISSYLTPNWIEHGMAHIQKGLLVKSFYQMNKGTVT